MIRTETTIITMHSNMPASGHRLVETVVDREMADLKAHQRAECYGQLLYSKCGSPRPRSLTVRTCLTDGQKMDAGDRQTEEGHVLTMDRQRKDVVVVVGGGGQKETCTDDG